MAFELLLGMGGESTFLEGIQMRNFIFSLILIQGIFCGSLGWGDGDVKSMDENQLERHQDTLNSMGDEIAPDEKARKMEEVDARKKALEEGRSEFTSSLLSMLPDKTVSSSPAESEKQGEEFKKRVGKMTDQELKDLKWNIDEAIAATSDGKDHKKNLTLQRMAELVAQVEESKKTDKKEDAKSGASAASSDSKVKEVAGRKLLGPDGKKMSFYKVDGVTMVADGREGLVLVEKNGTLFPFAAKDLGVEIGSDGKLSLKSDFKGLGEGVQSAPVLFDDRGEKWTSRVSHGDKVYHQKEGRLYISNSDGSIKAAEGSRPPAVSTALGGAGAPTTPSGPK